MKLLLFSDTHRRLDCCYAALEEYPDCEGVLHMGDVEQDAQRLAKTAGVPVTAVCGNNDYFHPQYPAYDILELDGVRVFLTHGHNYGVRSGDFFRLARAALQNGCQIALFGHTHIPYLGELDGITLCNPGAAAFGYYGVLTQEYGEIQIALYPGGQTKNFKSDRKDG